MLRRSAPIATLAVLLIASVLQSQVVVIPDQLPMETRVNNIAINAVIGSVTGLAWATIRHSSKWRGATRGAAGGVLISVGKQIASTAFDGSGFLGREVSAVGTSLAVSAGEPQTAFTFPIGPLNLQYGGGSWDWRINTADAISTLRYAMSSHTRFDLQRSMSCGAPVFRDDRVNLGFDSDFELAGITGFGTIRLSRRAFELPGMVDVIYHENVHVLQEDYLNQALAFPIERKAIEHLPFGRRFLRHLDAGVAGPMIVGGLQHFIRYDSRPWEREAYALTANLFY